MLVLHLEQSIVTVNLADTSSVYSLNDPEITAGLAIVRDPACPLWRSTG